MLYAGSLVTPMEGPIKAALLASGIDFQGEPGGSKALANLIAGGVRFPDVFVSVDPHLVTKLGGRVASAMTFAGTSLGVAWAPNSRYAATFDAVADGKSSLQRALETPGIRIGRTDPQLDPKGEYTSAGRRDVVRLRRANVAFSATTKTRRRSFPSRIFWRAWTPGKPTSDSFIARRQSRVVIASSHSPANAALTDRITYTLAIMKAPPHPKAARTFADFILTGAGRTILERAGLTYLHAPKVLMKS